ncbi:MAG: HEAT repeat domain-containing protein [Myxococcales bacterium]|nr:HEAT repeat domain-containing protein [Myxococcales bacterium]
MQPLRQAIFGTSGRRWATLLIANLAFFGAALGIHRYIDESIRSPGLSFALVALWVALGLLCGLASVIALGDYLFYRGFTEHILRDEMAELDARISGEATATEVDEDEEALALSGRGSGVRFWLYFMVFSMGLLGVTNAISGGFIQRYSHPGVAVIHMRAPDPAVRRAGMNMLADRPEFVVTPALEKVVIAALNDADEGVAARAAHVAGMHRLAAAIEPLAEMARTREALTFTALIALGLYGHHQEADDIQRRAGDAARTLVDDPVVRKEPEALALMLGLLRVPAIERLREIQTTAADAENVRLAAVWALGQLRDPRLFSAIAAALEDPALVVRCAAVNALELMVVFESSVPLRATWERTRDPNLMCPERNLPVQEGGPIMPIVRQRNFLFGVVRALATTDDPELLTWLVKHQDDTEDYRTRTLMRTLWEDLKQKDADGRLNHLRRHLLQKAALQGAPDGGSAPAASDAGVGDAGSAPSPDGGAPGSGR